MNEKNPVFENRIKSETEWTIRTSKDFERFWFFFRSGVKWRTDEQNAISQKKAESDYFRSSKIIQGYTDPFIPNHSILLETRVSEFEKLIISKYIWGEGKASNSYIFNVRFWKQRYWWWMLEKKWVGDKFEVLVRNSVVLDTNIRHLWTPAGFHIS